MKTSTDRILTTHTGSLPRPKPLIDLILRREKDTAVDRASAGSRDRPKRPTTSSPSRSPPASTWSATAKCETVLHDVYPPPRHRHRARPARRREGPRHHDRARSPGASGFRPNRRTFSEVPFPGCVGDLRYKDRTALDRDLAQLKAAAAKIAADRSVHDRAVAGNFDALHHQSALPDRGGLCCRARRSDESRIPRHRRSRLRAADRLPGSRLLPQQSVPRT